VTFGQIVPFGVAEKLLIARDVTHVEAVARMRCDFIANVSHELKTPLTVISGFVETLQELDLDEAAAQRFLQLMREQCHEHAAAGRTFSRCRRSRRSRIMVADEPFAIVPPRCSRTRRAVAWPARVLTI
jgi:signal transduction histidine kinase